MYIKHSENSNSQITSLPDVKTLMHQNLKGMKTYSVELTQTQLL